MSGRIGRLVMDAIRRDKEGKFTPGGGTAESVTASLKTETAKINAKNLDHPERIAALKALSEKTVKAFRRTGMSEEQAKKALSRAIAEEWDERQAKRLREQGPTETEKAMKEFKLPKGGLKYTGSSGRRISGGRFAPKRRAQDQENAPKGGARGVKGGQFMPKSGGKAKKGAPAKKAAAKAKAKGKGAGGKAGKTATVSQKMKATTKEAPRKGLMQPRGPAPRMQRGTRVTEPEPTELPIQAARVPRQGTVLPSAQHRSVIAGLPTPNSAAAKNFGARMHQMIRNAFAQGTSAETLAQAIKEMAGGRQPGSGGNFAERMLRYMEQAHGMSPGALGHSPTSTGAQQQRGIAGGRPAAPGGAPRGPPPKKGRPTRAIQSKRAGKFRAEGYPTPPTVARLEPSTEAEQALYEAATAYNEPAGTRINRLETMRDPETLEYRNRLLQGFGVQLRPEHNVPAGRHEPAQPKRAPPRKQMPALRREEPQPAPPPTAVAGELRPDDIFAAVRSNNMVNMEEPELRRFYQQHVDNPDHQHQVLAEAARQVLTVKARRRAREEAAREGLTHVTTTAGRRMLSERPAPRLPPVETGTMGRPTTRKMHTFGPERAAPQKGRAGRQTWLVGPRKKGPPRGDAAHDAAWDEAMDEELYDNIYGNKEEEDDDPYADKELREKLTEILGFDPWPEQGMDSHVFRQPRHAQDNARLIDALREMVKYQAWFNRRPLGRDEFDPNQPRDESGKWTSGGAAGRRQRAAPPKAAPPSERRERQAPTTTGGGGRTYARDPNDPASWPPGSSGQARAGIELAVRTGRLQREDADRMLGMIDEDWGESAEREREFMRVMESHVREARERAAATEPPTPEATGVVAPIEAHTAPPEMERQAEQQQTEQPADIGRISRSLPVPPSSGAGRVAIRQMVVEALNRGTDPERIAQAVRTMTRRYRAPRVADFSDDILRRLEDGFHMPEGILGTTLVAGSRPGTGGRGLDPARGGTRTGTRRESRASRREREQREYTQQRERQRQLERERQRQLEQSPVVETRVPGRESTRKLDWTKEELQDLLGKAHRQANRMTESRIDWANLSSEEAHEEDRKRTAAGFIASIIERGSGYYHGDYVTSIDVDDDGNPAAAAMIRVKEAGRPITTAEVPLIGSIKVGRGLRVMRDVAKRAKESGVKFLKGYALADASKIYSKLGAKYTQDFMNERYPKGGASGGMTLDLRGMAFDMALDELTEDDFPIGAWGHKNW